MAMRAAPFDAPRDADPADVAINPYKLSDAVARIERAFARAAHVGCRPIAPGKNLTITPPVQGALRKRHGPLGLIQLDAHADVNDLMVG